MTLSRLKWILAATGSFFCQAAPQPLFCAVEVNGILLLPQTMIRMEASSEGDPVVWLTLSDAEKLKLDTSTLQKIQSEQQVFVAPCAEETIDCYFNEDDQSLSIWALPEVFKTESAKNQSRLYQQARLDSGSGLLVNQRSNLLQIEKEDAVFSNLSELVWFTPDYQLNSRLLVQYQQQQLHADNYGVNLQWDDLQQASSWIVGNTVTAPLPGRTQQAFSGVRYGSNYALTPELRLTAVPEFYGQVHTPSSIELYQDELLLSSNRFDFGNYQLEFPGLTGGITDFSLITRDPSGAVINRQNFSFYLSPLLLADGIRQFSWEAGIAADDPFRYRRHDNDIFLAYAERRGLSSTLTSSFGARLKAGDSELMLGLATNVLQKLIVEYQLTAVQRDRRDFRHSLTVEHSKDSLSLFLRSERSTVSTVPENSLFNLTQLKQFDLAQISTQFSTGWLGQTSISLSHSRQQAVDRPAEQQSQLALRWQPGPDSSIALTFQRQHGQMSENRVGLFWFWMLSPSTTTSLNLERQQQVDWQQGVQWRDLDPATEQLAYMTVNGQQLEADGGMLYWQRQYNAGRLDVGMFQLAQHQQANVGFSSAFGWLDSKFFHSAPISDAFIMVDTQVPELGIELNNQLVGHTDADGYLVLPDVQGNVLHQIEISTEALPVDYSVLDGRREVLIGNRRGAVLPFSLRTSRIASIYLRDERGNQLPLGSKAEFSHLTEPTWVGHAGEVFLDVVWPETSLFVYPETGPACVVHFGASQPLRHGGYYVCMAID